MNKENNAKRNMGYIRIMAIGLIIIGSISTAVFAINSTQETENKNTQSTDQQANPSESKAVLHLSDKSIATYEEWAAAMERSSKKLTQEQVRELYDLGYDFYDIQIAEELAVFCDNTPRELLALKGKTTFEVIEGEIRENSQMQWDDIVELLDIQLVKPTEALGIPESQINAMKSQGLSEKEIQEVTILSFNYNKEYNEILAELKSGSKVDDLKKNYWEERMEESRTSIVPVEVAGKNTEKVLIRQYGITEEDIRLCNENGVASMVDIAVAKDIVNNSEKSLKEVLDSKKTKSNWVDVKVEMGVPE